MTAVALADTAVAMPEPMPRTRLTLRATPATLSAVVSLVELLPIAGSPATMFAPFLASTLTMITGGLVLWPDDDLPGGCWVLDADGVELARGTVQL